MFKDDYDALDPDKSKFENDYGYPPQDIKIAGKDLKFFTFTIYKMKEKICIAICKITFNKVCLGWCDSKCCK